MKVRHRFLDGPAAYFPDRRHLHPTMRPLLRPLFAPASPISTPHHSPPRVPSVSNTWMSGLTGYIQCEHFATAYPAALVQ